VGSDVTPVLEVRDVVKHFDVARRPTRRGSGPSGRSRVLHAVDGVSFMLWPGRVVALVGESGCGKSTVARLIAQLQRATSGAIVLDGVEARVRSRRSRRAWTHAVQMVFQDPFSSLNPLHTIRYQISRPLANHAEFRGLPRAEQLEELLGTVQLQPAALFLNKHPHELSGGQRQRVAIARALAARPRVLVADEPVSMLDVSIRLGVLNLLTRLGQERGLAVLYITHDIASARYSADETLVMYAGQLVEGGPSEQLTQAPAHPYTKLLIASAPDPRRRGAKGQRSDAADGRPGSDSGTLPDPFNPPVGCRFADRCPFAMTVCRERPPPATDLGTGHWVRCFLHGGD
jgi:peptide/nickel transport system ATP-binding protein